MKCEKIAIFILVIITSLAVFFNTAVKINKGIRNISEKINNIDYNGK